MTYFNVKICRLLFDQRDHNIFNITFCIQESYHNSSQRDRINVIFFASIPSPQIVLYLSLIIYTTLFQSISIPFPSYGLCPSPLLLTDSVHPLSFLRILYSLPTQEMKDFYEEYGSGNKTEKYRLLKSKFAVRSYISLFFIFLIILLF